MSQSVQLTTYLHFEGDCEEAMTFYATLLDGCFEVVTRYDNPAMKAPDHYRNKILHGRLYFGNQTIMASDASPGNTITKGGGDVYLSLAFTDEQQAKKVFEELAAGGKVRIPFARQFWGDWHGNLIDRYGIRWMVNYRPAND